MIVTGLQAAYAPQLASDKVIPITNILSMIQIPHKLCCVFLMLFVSCLLLCFESAKPTDG